MGNDDTAHRDSWGSKLEFILASIGWAVGYGNVWRFPYIVFQHGGGAFFIPFIISLLFAGVPAYALECSIGQYARLGPNKAFRYMAPLFHGVGWAMIVVSVLVSFYFNMLISWSLYYLYHSFTFTGLFAWSSCRNEYNTERCFSDLEDELCEKELGDGAMFFNKSCHEPNAIAGFINGTEQNVSAILQYYKDAAGENLNFPADEFFRYDLLQQSDSMNETGGIVLHLLICNALAWLLVYFCIFNGVKSSGKVVYFTATFPYVLITALLVRGALLDGAADGIRFYLSPDFSRLWSAEIWNDAAVQVFYTYGVAFGVVIAFSSYNSFRSNCFWDAFTICPFDSATSFYTGFAIFSTAGFIAKKLNRHRSKVDFQSIIRNGEGLAFVVFAEAISRMPVPWLWAIVFFFMMVLIGIDSQFPMMEVGATAMLDEFPVLRRWKPVVMAVACCFGFLAGLPLCTNAGFYWFSLVAAYSAGWSLLVVAAVEVLVVVYVYGIRKFMADCELMFGVKSKITWAYWLFVWCAFTPVFLLVVCIAMLTAIKPLEVDGKPIPVWAQIIGHIMSVSSIACIPIFGLYQIIRNRKHGEPWMALLQPKPKYDAGAEYHTGEPRRRRADGNSSPRARSPASVHPNPPSPYEPKFVYSNPTNVV